MPSKSTARPPAADPALLAELLEALKSHALRITQPRTRMLGCLLRAEQPMSIETLCAGSGGSGEKLTWTTAYRFLLELERIGLVRRVHVSPSLSHFELALPDRHHDHLVCNGCGTVTALQESCPVAELEKRVASRYGFTEVTHSLEFHGLCPSCSKTPSFRDKSR